jgi:hypothetical protein
MLLNFYPKHKNEVSFLFIKFNVAIKLQVFSILFVLPEDN